MSGNEFTIDIGKHGRDRIAGGGRGSGGLCMLEAVAGGTVPEHGGLVAASVDHIIESSKIDEVTFYHHSVCWHNLLTPRCELTNLMDILG